MAINPNIWRNIKVPLTALVVYTTAALVDCNIYYVVKGLKIRNFRISALTSTRFRNVLDRPLGLGWLMLWIQSMIICFKTICIAKRRNYGVIISTLHPFFVPILKWFVGDKVYQFYSSKWEIRQIPIVGQIWNALIHKCLTHAKGILLANGTERPKGRCAKVNYEYLYSWLDSHRHYPNLFQSPMEEIKDEE